MSCPPGRRALLWAVLLLPGFQPQGTQAWCSEEDMDSYNMQVRNPEFLPTVKFALNTFNQQTKDEYAYRLVRILSSSKDQVNVPIIFSMKLKLGRTICRKFEFDIDSCPFQDGTELNNTFTCLFTIRTQHLVTPFSVLKKTCSEGPP